MQKPQGYAIITDPCAHTKEWDTYTCCHCNRVTFVPAPPTPMPGGFCRMCMKPICEACCDFGCIPFEKKLEEMEARDRFLRAF